MSLNFLSQISWQFQPARFRYTKGTLSFIIYLAYMRGVTNTLLLHEIGFKNFISTMFVGF
jgi:hypothetical protein